MENTEEYILALIPDYILPPKCKVIKKTTTVPPLLPAVPFLRSCGEEVGRFMLDMHRKKSVQVLLSTSKFLIQICENDDHPLQINPGLC